MGVGQLWAEWLEGFFFKDFIYLFLERGTEGERERNINVWLPFTCPLLGTWPATQARALTGNRTGNPLVHRHTLNPLSSTSQGGFYSYREIISWLGVVGLSGACTSSYITFKLLGMQPSMILLECPLGERSPTILIYYNAIIMKQGSCSICKCAFMIHHDSSLF